MNINKHVHIKLTSNDVKEIIKKHLIAQGYKVDMKDIEFNFNQGSYYESATFEGCSIVANEQKYEE